MADLSKGIIQRAIQQGKTKATLEISKGLMKTQNWTALQAIKAIGISENEIPEYLTLLEEKN